MQYLKIFTVLFKFFERLLVLLQFFFKDIYLVKTLFHSNFGGFPYSSVRSENIFRYRKYSDYRIIINTAAFRRRYLTNQAWSMLTFVRFCFRNNANVVVPPTVSAASKKEPHENIARIAKRYLDDNMQQAWINPRLISMVSEYKCNDYAPGARACRSVSIILGCAGELRARTFRAGQQISLRRTSTLGKFRD